MINIAVCGQGAMGRVVEQEIASYENIEFLGFLSPKNGQYGEELSGVDVIIDFSNPDNLDFIIEYAISNNSALLICTTGYDDEQKNKIYEAGMLIPILLSSNTSTGINIVRKMLKLISDDLGSFDIDIVERHHSNKIDSPSGTAKKLAEDIIDATGRNKIEMHSLRSGTIPGEHQVIFSGVDEVIEIKHTAFSKKIFARGALDIAIKLAHKKAGYYTTEDMFEIDKNKLSKIISIA